MHAPRKIVHVVLSMDVGGLERVVLDLAREGQSRGQRVSIICLERPGMLAPQVQAAGIPLWCVDKRPGLRCDVVGRLRGLLHQLRPDIAHTHQVGALFYTGLAAWKMCGLGVVHTEHSQRYAEHFRTRLLACLANRFAHRVCCVSRDIADRMRADRVAPSCKIVVVANGIDTGRMPEPIHAAALRRSLGIPAGVPVIGTVGRLAEVKRQDALLRAFAVVQASIPEAHLILVGEGPLRGALEKLGAALQLDHVHFVGYQSNPEPFYRLLTTFALTSRSEGMPLAILEAGAAGAPVVATRVGGVPEVIIDGQTGSLVDPGDERGLAEAILRYCRDPELGRRTGAAARQHIEAHYSCRAMADNYESQYLQTLTREHRRAS
jgi:glycosyltransferase involved in cell wall biosynthesis